MRKNLATGVVNVMFIFGVVSVAQAALVISDFSWLPDGKMNIASTVLSDGTQFTLESDPVKFDRNSMNGARIIENTRRNTTITLTFDRTLDDLRLLIGDLDLPGAEFFRDFSTLPSSVDGTLYISGETVKSHANNGGGNLIWNDVSSVSFVFDRDQWYNMGIRLTEFEYSTVPLPSAVWLFATGALSLAAYRRKMRA